MSTPLYTPPNNMATGPSPATIKAQVKIEDIIGKSFELKGKPGDMRALDHPSLSVNTITQTFRWYSHNESGDIFDWIENRDGVDFKQAKETVMNSAGLGGRQETAYDIERRKQIEREREQKRHEQQQQQQQRQQTATDRIAGYGPKVAQYHSQVDRDYWHSEGLNDDTIDRFNLGYTDSNPLAPGASHVIPYYHNGTIIHIRHRLVTENGGKYRPEFAGLPNQLFNADVLQPDELAFGPLEAGAVVLVEGEKKAMVLDQFGIKAVAIAGLNAWRPEWVEMFKDVNRVLIALDPGAEQQAFIIAIDLLNAGITPVVVTLPHKPDDFFVKLAHQGDVDEFVDILKRGETVTPNTIFGPKTIAKSIERETFFEDRRIEKHERDARNQPVTKPGLEFFDDYSRVIEARQTFGSANEWMGYVKKWYPELDPEHERQVKLDENRDKRIGNCGRPILQLSTTGEWEIKQMMCGLCAECLKRDADNLRQALDEYMETGEITVIVASDKAERDKITRSLRYHEVDYKVYPVTTDDGTAYEILAGAYMPLLGEILDPILLTEDRLLKWVDTPKSAKTSGKLVASKRQLRKGERGMFETAPSKDTVEIDLPGIVLERGSEIEPIAYPTEVTTIDEYREALREMHEQQVTRLASAGIVVLGVVSKKIHTPKATIPELLHAFNETQAAIKAKAKANQTEARPEQLEMAVT